MSAIPLYDLDEVATKRDLAVLRAELSADFRRELNEGLGISRTEFDTKLGTLRNELRNELGTLRQSVEKRFDRLLFAMIAMPVAIIGAFVAILRYLD